MSALFSPLRIGQLDFSNRVFVAPMCQYSGVDGLPSDWHCQHYGSLAVGGAGAITLEATAVAPEGRITNGCLGLWNDAQASALAQLINSLRRLSPTRLGIQLSHAGRKASCHPPWAGGEALAQGGWPIVAPSAIAFGPNRSLPSAMTEADFEQISQAFEDGARRALRAGFDYLELHLAHGYLLSSFLSPLANCRGDRYGGPLSNRMRFPLEVVSKVRAVWPDSKPLGVRVNAHDWCDGGAGFEDTLALCHALKSAGVDFVCVSAGAVVDGTRISATPGYLFEYARRVREATGMVTRAVGLIHDSQLAEQALCDGVADCVAVARAMLFDPRWALKAAYLLGEGARFPPQMMLASPERWPGAEAALSGMRSGTLG
ncbi:NADH:flavin oxidoreductase/NADH oxidase [Denitromonas ohlonensis]|uniref:NADH:flavin oxidoreductase/NADH oxidase n=2 Tax=Denitromonas TaxID=139331 RepID=A0A558EQR0_9RHOO|nr:NADH:flavin oxidoreductase/NADH oxidase [Denitromonas ohlonensis]TVT48693.1 MAG: NADH:flavin oxidoreductase/NADH oxidase [Denitromonas halophila]TVO63562.1 NADH:flavin oxidoreductase/NADH oxidase [Denitromonas ohlonensis]TVO75439.1 NADH:flavin oxidoreductase/NADH oxidase [Denitromonas ohlonensis]TVT70562.1 MAG: NADH:flavin oxidoreductase/NADH oxidase [Denitromonas halophila]TVT75684.1 MAG: NADH:flavin oxidoreductase/NADH oxidase [Denitromonas halophila]